MRDKDTWHAMSRLRPQDDDGTDNEELLVTFQVLQVGK